MRLITGFIVAAGLFAQGWTTDCPGYHVIAAEDNGNTLTAQLRLSGKNCDLYGQDLPKLKLQVEYQTGETNHGIILSNLNANYLVRISPSRQDL